MGIANLCRRLFPAGKRLDSLLAADAGNFAAQWWPDAAYEELVIATWLSIWVSQPHFGIASSTEIRY